MPSPWDLANPQLRDFVVYEPGKPIEETARELQVSPDDIIKLASNENPLGPSPKAVAAMRDALAQAHLYPDGSGYYLRKALGAHLGVESENIILGNGSNEIIEFLGHAFLGRADDEVVLPEYAFIAYKLIAKLFGARVVEVPGRDFCADLGAIGRAITSRTRLVCIANPNNPTGTLVGQDEIDRFVSSLPPNVIAVLDEAYFEFLDEPPDALQYVRQNRNVVLLRTFSKIHGLASLRVGYGIAARPLIEVLQKVREPFNVNGIAQAGALAALNDRKHQRKSKLTVDEGRAYLKEQFKEMKLQFVGSAGNFLMVNVGDGVALFKEMLKRKVIVRPVANYKLPKWVRISVGTMDQNRRCIAALKEVLSKQAAS